MSVSCSGRGVLLDIEGTTTSVRFVHDVLCPFARRHLRDHLADLWDTPAIREACEHMARDAGSASAAAWWGDCDEEAKRDRVCAEASRLMDADAKATGLKQLQGLVWASGFRSGALRAHVYDDVPPALAAWVAAGREVRIYSSGSVGVQKLFFGRTVHGDLTPLLSGHYDTTTGPKTDRRSYEKIAAGFLPAPSILFISDVVAELDAAREAGMRTALSCRPGQGPVSPGHGHEQISSFDQVVCR